MHDIAPRRIAVGVDVFTISETTSPRQTVAGADEVILVSVTDSQAALDEFPSEQAGHPEAAAADVPFGAEATNLDDLFVAEHMWDEPVDVAIAELIPPVPLAVVDVALETTKVDALAKPSPPPVAADIVTPPIDIAIVTPPPAIVTPPTDIVTRPTDIVPPPTAIVTRRTDTFTPRADTVAPRTDVVTPRTTSRRYVPGRRSVIGGAVAATLLVATAVTLERNGNPLFYAGTASASAEPAAPRLEPAAPPIEPAAPPLDATMRTSPEPLATAPTADAVGPLGGDPRSREEPVPAASTDSTVAREAARAAAVPAASRALEPPKPPRPTGSIRDTSSSARAELPATASVAPAAPISPPPQLVVVEPIVPTLLPARPAAAELAMSATVPPAANTASLAPAASAAETAIASRAADDGAVHDVLGKYRSAYSRLNASAAASIWPTVDAKALGKAFERLETQEIEFDRCDVVLTGSRAVATCGGRARYVPKVGNKSAHVEARQWRFDLRKANETWLIEGVSAR